MKKNTLRRAAAALLALTMALTLLPLPASAVIITVVGNNEALLMAATVDAYDDEKWESSDPTVAVAHPLSDNPAHATIEAIKEGSVTITFTATSQQNGETITKTFDIVVNAAQEEDSGDGGEEDSDPVAVTGVSLDKSTLSLNTATNQSATLTATVAPDNATNKAVKWTSGNEAVASVDQSGNVTAKKGGTATITVTTEDGKKTATCTVTVTQPLNSISLATAPTRPLEAGGDKLNLKEYLTFTPASATNKGVKWTIATTSTESESTVATIDQNGIVTPVAPGTARVTVTSDDGGHKYIYDVVVSGIWLERTSVELYAGESKTLAYKTYGGAEGLSVTWETQNPSVAEVSGSRVHGYNPGSTTVTAKVGNGVYEKECRVTVAEDVADAVFATVDAGMALSFADLLHGIDGEDGLIDVCEKKTEADLECITSISVPTSQGILHYGYVSPDSPGQGVGTESYYLYPGNGQRDLADLSFAPRTDFTGTAVIDYTGRNSEGGSFKGSIRVEVLSTGDVTYGTAAGRPVAFETEDFTAVCKAKTGREIEYITFTQPASSQGTLYYNYTPTGQYAPEVSSATKYYRTNNPYLSNISFVPAENYTGEVEISYRCTTSGGTHPGTVTINVYDPDGTGEGQVEYSVAPGGHVDLDAADFNDACQEVLNANLSYIYFDLPDDDEGILYYNYSTSSNYGSRVLSTTRYFRGSSPRISYITFVPKDNFNGTVRIPFTAYDTTGDSYDGELVIRVSGSDGTVHYTSSFGQPVEFDGLDFNEACQTANGASMDWVSFEQPRSSVGTLYRNYRSSSSKGSKVSESSTFTRSTISDVTFVPDDDFSGTATIYFSGEDTKGARFSGEVKITVGEDGGDEVVRYTTVSGGLVNFDADDFNDACQAITGENLRYVRFDLPPSREGKLYYNYNSSRDSGTSVSSSTSYYRTGGSRKLDDVSFLASTSLTSTAVIEYTGWSTGNEKFTGTVEVSVAAAVQASRDINYMGSSLPITLWEADFRAACSAALGGTLSYIRFDELPAETMGRLYLGYDSPIKPGVAVTTNTTITASGSTGVGQLTFLPKAEYQGQVDLTYTGWDTQGRSYTGTVGIDLSNYHCTTAFTDLYGYDWAKPSIEFLRRAGITNGYSATSFGPERQINRGEFALMVCRAFQLNTGSTSSFPDVPADSVYAWAVATAKDLGIAEGNNGLFNPTSPITRQSAMAMIYRAMRAAGIITPAASTSILSSYPDGRQVATHAKVPVAALIQMGAVKGNTSAQLKPTTAISRAEMAVILHRVLTA